MARDRQSRWVAVGAIAAVFNPLVNLIAIPETARAFGNGAVGAAIVTVATEMLMLGGALYLLRADAIPDRQTLGFLFRCAAACATMVGVVVICGGIWLPARIVVGVISYGLASLVVGTLSAGELRRRSHQLLALVRPRSAPSIP
jgi:hypothetical protein